MLLRPSEFRVGTFAQAGEEGLTLMLPRSRYDQTMLIIGKGEAQRAVFLAEHEYEAFACADNDALKGILIPGVGIEIDRRSMFNPSDEDLRSGMLVREADALKIVVSMRDDYRITRNQKISLLEGLSPCRDREAAAFRKWQIVLGEGDDKRVLHEVTIPMPEGN